MLVAGSTDGDEVFLTDDGVSQASTNDSDVLG